MRKDRELRSKRWELWCGARFNRAWNEHVRIKVGCKIFKPISASHFHTPYTFQNIHRPHKETSNPNVMLKHSRTMEQITPHNACSTRRRVIGDYMKVCYCSCSEVLLGSKVECWRSHACIWACPDKRNNKLSRTKWIRQDLRVYTSFTAFSQWEQVYVISACKSSRNAITTHRKC